MNVFNSLPDPYESARCLHPKYHLGNQFYREGMTILTGGWKNHPVSKMYENYKYYLTSYLLACQCELQRRGKWYGKTAVRLRKLRKNLRDTGYPPFIGDSDFHISHRSKLLFKGSIFGLTDAISEYLGISYRKWKDMFQLPERNQINHEQRDKLLIYCKKKGIKFINWYEQFGWTESDNLEYIWFD